MSYEPFNPATQPEADLRQLRGLARAGFAAHDDDLMRGDGFCDLLAPRADRQLGRKLGARRKRAALLDLGRRESHYQVVTPAEAGVQEAVALCGSLFPEQAFRVAREWIYFQIDAVAHPKILERRRRERMRDQVDLELDSLHCVHREA